MTLCIILWDVLYAIAADPGTIAMVQGFGFSMKIRGFTASTVEGVSGRFLRRPPCCCCLFELLGEHVQMTPSFAIYLPRSRNLVRRLPFKRDTIVDMHMLVYLWLYPFRIFHVFWTAWGCVDEFSFHVLLWSGTEFRHHLPVVLWLHNLLSRTCIWRTAGRCCRNFVSDRSRAWKLNLSTHPRVGLGPIFTYY
jgi:hypothetical protein